MICTQLGDPDNKVASNADYHLANLLAEHPNMKVIDCIFFCHMAHVIFLVFLGICTLTVTCVHLA